MRLKIFPKIILKPSHLFLKVVIFFLLLTLIVFGVFKETTMTSKIKSLQNQNTQLENTVKSILTQLKTTENDQEYLKNRALNSEIENIQKTFKGAVSIYENMLDVKSVTVKTSQLDEMFALTLTMLSERQYASAAAKLKDISSELEKVKAQIAAASAMTVSAPVNNVPPEAGFNRQTVKTDVGDFVVDIVAADLGNTRVVVDTASSGDCTNDCPTLSLSTYVSRNGGYAGINGSYFCPASYPSCSGKKNSFDTLLMNKDKVYFNSNNNIYSTVPAVIFLGTSVRFVSQSLEWGRDTGVDGVLANQPLLLSAGNIVFGGDGDPKKGSRGARSFVGNKGQKIYIGVVRLATVAEVAHVLKNLGLENALNLDSGGSTALWYGGYKAGPGRDIPNAIVLVKR